MEQHQQHRMVLGSVPRDVRIERDRTWHVVKLLFYQYADMMTQDGLAPREQQGATWNWLAACWTGGGLHVQTERVSQRDMAQAILDGRDVPEPIYVHVEMRFSDGYGTSITSNDDCVHYEKRLHTRPNYSFVCEYLMTPQDEERMQRHARRAHEQQVGFNRTGFVLNFLPVIGPYVARSRSRQVFCSEYIVELLHTANRLLDVNPHTTSPQQLYHIMRQEMQCGNALLSWNRELGSVAEQGLLNPAGQPPSGRPGVGRARHSSRHKRGV